MSITDELLRNAEEYAANFDKGELPLPPAKGVAVVACMDARLIPTRVLGLEEAARGNLTITSLAEESRPPAATGGEHPH